MLAMIRRVSEDLKRASMRPKPRIRLLTAGAVIYGPYIGQQDAALDRWVCTDGGHSGLGPTPHDAYMCWRIQCFDGLPTC
jgi:hypothetical protein